MPEIVQDIGAYAGLASVVGLAVLSALYFSQARDVKRLREWAGRAPERAADGGPVPGRVTTAPQAQPAAKPGPPGVPAPAAGAAKTPGAPVPAGGAGKRPGPPGVPTPAPAASKPPAGPPVRPGAPVPVPAVATAAAGTAAAGTAAATAAVQNRQAGSNAGAGASAVAARPPAPAAAGGPATPAGGRPPGAPPVPATPRPISQPTTIIPPERHEPWYRRLLANPLYIVLTVAGVLVLGGAAVFAVSEITGDDPGTTAEPRTGAGGGAPPAADAEQNGGGRSRAPVNPSKVTVAVLNGTTVPGLAAGVADEVKSFGFQIGTVANAPDQESQRAESVVLFAPGHRREARAVSRRLDIPQRERVDPESQGLAGDAGVVVVAGGDLANQ